jgi:hypothetical protein
MTGLDNPFERSAGLPVLGGIYLFNFDNHLADKSVMCKVRPIIVLRVFSATALVVPLSTRFLGCARLLDSH